MNKDVVIDGTTIPIRNGVPDQKALADMIKKNMAGMEGILVDPHTASRPRDFSARFVKAPQTK